MYNSALPGICVGVGGVVVVGLGVRVGMGVDVGLGVCVGIGVAVSVGMGVNVGIGVEVGVSVGSGVAALVVGGTAVAVSVNATVDVAVVDMVGSTAVAILSCSFSCCHTPRRSVVPLMSPMMATVAVSLWPSGIKTNHNTPNTNTSAKSILNAMRQGRCRRRTAL